MRFKPGTVLGYNTTVFGKEVGHIVIANRFGDIFAHGPKRGSELIRGEVFGIGQRIEIIAEHMYADSLEATLDRIDAMDYSRPYDAFSLNCEHRTFAALGHGEISPQCGRAAKHSLIGALIFGGVAILAKAKPHEVGEAAVAGAGLGHLVMPIGSLKKFYTELGFVRDDYVLGDALIRAIRQHRGDSAVIRSLR